MRNLWFMALILACAAPAVLADAPASPQMFSFPIPWDDAAHGVAADVSFLNTTPAGAGGRIVVRNGHFYEERTGKRVRFLGTNFTFEADFPTREDADRIAAHIARLGINIVRIHHEDIDHSPLWDRSAPGHTKLDAAALDRLDYLIAQLKKNGVYVDLNLHVSRQFVPADGFPDSVKDLPAQFDKRIDNIDTRMIALQKQFAHDYLTHINPYTGLSYASDPEVALIEINNENSLVGVAGTGADFCDSLPEPFRSEVVGDWNDWLRRRYGTRSRLATAWFSDFSHATDAPPAVTSSNVWSLEDSTGQAVLSRRSAESSETAPDIAVHIPTQSTPEWHIQAHLAGLDLREGEYYTLAFRAMADRNRQVPIYAGLDEEDWRHVGLEITARVAPEWKAFRYTFQASRTVPNHSRISFVLGGAAGDVSIAGLSLTIGSAAAALPAGQSLAARNIDIPISGSRAELADWGRFLAEEEASYAADMREYLRRDLKVQANIIDTQMSYGGLSCLNREADSDYADNHAYWQHPKFPDKPWDAVNWTIENTPMVQALAKGEGGTLAGLAEYRPSGKPYTVSEYNHPAPSDWRCEMYPEIATFAALQDWDGVFEFDYGNYVNPSARGKIQGFFAEESDPAREAFLPAAAMIFRGFELEPAPGLTTLTLPQAAAFSGSDAYSAWRDACGESLPNLLSSRFEIRLDRSAARAKIGHSGGGRAADRGIALITGPSGPIYTAAGKGCAVAAGFIGSSDVDLGAVRIVAPAFGDSFAGLALTALDNLPLDRSARLLLTIVGKAENTGMVWNSERTSVGAGWGHAPAQAEGIPATITVANAVVRRVFALDASGSRKSEMPATVSSGQIRFSVGPADNTVWYELAR